MFLLSGIHLKWNDGTILRGQYGNWQVSGADREAYDMIIGPGNIAPLGKGLEDLGFLGEVPNESAGWGDLYYIGYYGVRNSKILLMSIIHILQKPKMI